MANPQRENGHIDIANEIAEHLAYYRLSGQEYQVLWVILRKTWGWQKKEDWISLSQFFVLTKMKKPSIIKTINKLLNKNIISKKANENNILYSFNKDFDKWKSLAKRLIVSKKANDVSKKANKSLAKRLPTIDNYTKDNITKESALKMHDKDFDLFWSIYPNKKSKKEALIIFKKINRDKLEIILQSVENYKKTEQWKNPKYIPHPNRFLSKERWEDEIEKVAPRDEIEAYAIECVNKDGRDWGKFPFQLKYGDDMLLKYRKFFDL